MRRAAVALLCLTLGCDPGFDARHLAALEDAVLAVDDALSIARVVTVDGPSAQTIDVPLSEGAATLFSRSPGEIVVLTQGVLGDEDEEPVPSEIVSIDRRGLIQRWPLEGQYETATMSPDGRYLATLRPRGRLVVENRVEVVDLSQVPGEANPIELSLRSLGGEAPSTAAFSSPLAWSDGRELRLAALFAAGQLSIFDMDAPDVPPITIPTTADGSTVGPSPIEGVFVGSELVIRSAGSAQLLVVTVGEGGGAQRFDVSVRTLAASGPVIALAVDLRALSPRIIALSSSSLHVFALETGLETVVPLPLGYGGVIQFDGPAPGDATTRPRLALFGNTPSITFVELGDEPAEVIDSSQLALTFAPSSVVVDPAAGRLIAFEGPLTNVWLDVAGSFGRRPTSIIDLYDRSALALAAAPEVTRSVVATDFGQMWVASEQGYVSRFDIETQDQRELWLHHPVQTLLPLFGETQRVLAFQSLDTGTFSVLEPDGDPRSVSNTF